MGKVASGIGGVLGGVVGGLTGGLSNTDKYQGAGAQIDAPVTVAQAQSAYGAAQDALDKQNAFVKALQGQNGVANQSAVFNQLQGVANGTGPNPALAQLNQATSANIANQAALMAGQRGAGANAGLVARQAALQGGNLQQQAVGQAATMQAQQQLNAMNQLGGIAGQQVGQQQNAILGANQAAQSEQQNLLNSINSVNNARVGMTSNQNNVNSAGALQNGANQAKMNSGLLQGAAMLAKGGEVPHYVDGGSVSSYNLGADTSLGLPQQNGPQSAAGRFMLFGSAPSNTDEQKPAVPQLMGSENKDDSSTKGGEAMAQGIGSIGSLIGGMFAKGGRVDAMVSPGEAYIPPKNAKKVADKKASPHEAGRIIPGKAKVKGDSLKNDTVPAKLEAGGVVIPRSIMQSKDAKKKAADFVAAVLAKKGLPK